jgi:hypothetical protein
MKPSRAIWFSVAAVVLVLLLVACVHPSDSGSSASGSSTSENSSGPQIESTTGLETAQSSTSIPSISMAPAPTGNDGTDGACPRAKWLGNPISHGDIITITSVIVQNPFRFDQAATAKCGVPSCINYQFNATNYDRAFCYVGVGYEQGSIDPDGTDTGGNLELIGYLKCPSNINFTACQRDATAMGRPGIGTVRFNVLTVDKSPTPSSSPTPSLSESTTSSPSESSSSSPSTSSSSSSTAPSSS